MTASPSDRVKAVNNFCASALVFSSAMTELLETRVHEALGNTCTLPQLRLLAMVDKTDVQHVTDVADFLDVSNAAASKAVDRLVRRGLIERRESERDRRAIRLLITQKGRDMIDSFENVQHQVFSELFDSVADENLQQTALLLDKLSIELVYHTGTEEGACLRCGIYFRDRCLLRETHDRDCRYHSARNP